MGISRYASNGQHRAGNRDNRALRQLLPCKVIEADTGAAEGADPSKEQCPCKALRREASREGQSSQENIRRQAFEAFRLQAEKKARRARRTQATRPTEAGAARTLQAKSPQIRRSHRGRKAGTPRLSARKIHGMEKTPMTPIPYSFRSYKKLNNFMAFDLVISIRSPQDARLLSEQIAPALTSSPQFLLQCKKAIQGDLSIAPTGSFLPPQS